MKLNELFDRPTKTKSIPMGDSCVMYDAHLSDGTRINIQFDQIRDYTEPNCWSIAFSRSGGNAGVGSTDKTGDGNEVEVMSTVMHEVQIFVKKHDPAMLEFMADISGDREMSRINLYNRIVNRFAAAAGYEVRKLADDEATVFQLIKQGTELEWKEGR